MNELSRREITHMVVSSLGLKPKNKIYPSTDSMFFHCCFHYDKTPSLSINFVTGQWHCFSCNRGGNIEGLYREVTGNSLYKELGINTDSFSSYARSNAYNYSFEEDYSLKVQPIEWDKSKTFSALRLRESRDYLKKRGISDSIARNANIMYSESVYVNGRAFNKRILIPIYEDKKLISLEGRRIVNNDEPKVLYPKGSSVNTLYDIDNLDKTQPLYIVEGLMDLFVLRNSEEFKNSSCIFGASLTKRQIHLLSQFEKVIIIPDSDKPGEGPLEKLKEVDRGQIFYLRLPREINNYPIKDVGDLPKANATIEDLLYKKWLHYIKPLDELNI